MPTFAYKRMAGAWVLMRLRNPIRMWAPRWWGCRGGRWGPGPHASLLLWLCVSPDVEGHTFTTVTSLDSVGVRVHATSLQSRPTLCDTMDCSPPGSSVHGILQTRIPEWAAVPSSRGFSWPRDQSLSLLHLLHWQAGSLPLVPSGSSDLVGIMAQMVPAWKMANN